MKNWNLYQLVTHVVNLTCNKDIEKNVIIRKLVQDNRSWSKFVQDKWTVQNEKSSEHMCSKITNSGKFTNNILRFLVKHQSKVMKYDHEVSLHSSGQVEIFCQDFKSNQNPCRHICRVKISQNGMSLFTVETLHPYWHLQNRLFYNGDVGNIVFDSSSIMTNQTVSKISVINYQKLVFLLIEE